MKLSKFMKTEWPKPDRGPMTRAKFLITTARCGGRPVAISVSISLVPGYGSHLESAGSMANRSAKIKGI
jgi:hypothetical protein